MKKYYTLAITLILILFVLCGKDSFSFKNAISKNANDGMGKTASKYGITKENFPKIDGSTSTYGIVRAIYKTMQEDYGEYSLSASKTVPSYESLINGDVDLIIVPYASSDILSLAKQKGVSLEFHTVAAEALIFITPSENTANNITLEQVREIYVHYGITNWSQLGGLDRELIPLCRNADSGSQSEMDNLILYREKMHPDIQKNFINRWMFGMLSQVAYYHEKGIDNPEPKNAYALGYTLYTYLKSVEKIEEVPVPELKILSFEGVAPSVASIKDGSYPLSSAYYAVVRSDLPKEHSARRVIRWLQSNDGQAIIESYSFIPKT